MAAPKNNTLMIEGSIEELTDELANFIDSLSKSEPIQPGVAKLMKDGKKEDALKVLVPRADALNAAPERCALPDSTR
jgi:translation initiation factor 3 subunit M